MRVSEYWGSGIVFGLLFLSAVLTVLFLLAAGLAYWAGASDLASISGIGALSSAVLLPIFAALIHIEEKEIRSKEKQKDILAEKAVPQLIVAGFLGIIALYAALQMVGIVVEAELVAIALVGLTAVGVLWTITRRPKDMEDLRRTLQELSEKVDRLSRLLEE